MISESPMCLECGLCCNGALFEQGELRPGDNAAALESLGVRIRPNRAGAFRATRFDQPCGAFDGCRCKAYSQRPAYCRAFECLLLKQLENGTLSLGMARKTVRLARRQVQRVHRLLEELGDSNDRAPLSRRFRTVQRRLETQNVNAEVAAVFGELTLAMSDLNRILRDHFVDA